MDDNLPWNDHIDYICSKVKQTLMLLAERGTVYSKYSQFNYTNLLESHALDTGRRSGTSIVTLTNCNDLTNCNVYRTEFIAYTV